MNAHHLSVLSSKRVIELSSTGNDLEAERSYREAQFFHAKAAQLDDVDHEYRDHMYRAAQGAILLHLPNSRIARDIRGH